MTGTVRVLLILHYAVASVICHDWNYHSYHEAITDDHHLCLGECNSGACVTNWHARIKPCHPKQEETKHYMSINNYPCQSNCDNFDNEPRQWCVTGDSDWDYCTRTLALKGQLKHTTRNQYVTCSGECGRHGNSYNWCKTITNWEKCYVDDKIFVPDYPTESNTRCQTPCMLYDSDRKAYCYDTKGDWVRCFLNPQYEHVLHSLTRKLRSSCKNKFGIYTTNGYRVCMNKNHLTSKRDTSDYEDLSFHECDLDVSAVAERHRANNPSDLVRTVRSHRPITTDTNPILSYTMMPRRVRFGERGTERDLDLPLVLEAQLTRHTLLPVGAPRESFPRYVTNHYNLMNPNRRGTTIGDNHDERGHILGSRHGGPMETFNIFPQAWRLNRGPGSTWYEMEEHMADFLRDRDDRYIEFLAVIGYLTDSNGRLITRPDHVGVRLRFHQNNILTDRHGRRLNSFEDNETENMFFSNDPDDDCIVMVANNHL